MASRCLSASAWASCLASLVWSAGAMFAVGDDGVTPVVPVGAASAVPVGATPAVPVGAPLAVPVGAPLAVPVGATLSVPVGAGLAVPVGAGLAVPVGAGLAVPVGAGLGGVVVAPVATLGAIAPDALLSAARSNSFRCVRNATSFARIAGSSWVAPEVPTAPVTPAGGRV